MLHSVPRMKDTSLLQPSISRLGSETKESHTAHCIHRQGDRQRRLALGGKRVYELQLCMIRRLPRTY